MDEMVRNKFNPQSSTSQPVPATASITRCSNAADIPSDKDLHNIEFCANGSASFGKNLKKRTGASNAKLPRYNANGIGGDAKSMDLHVKKINAGASGAIVQLTNINGYHNKGLQSADIDDNSSMLRDEISPMRSEYKTDNDVFSSRMHASTRNIYRKMFGRYKVGQELLARWSDGLYYLGVICDVYDHKLQCEMKFEDDSKFWVHYKDLHRIEDTNDTDGKSTPKLDEDAADEESDVTCVLCRDGTSDPPNEIVLCDKCGQGYHQQCHLPNIDDTVLKDEEVPWQCRDCVFSACVRVGGAIKHGLGEIMKQMKCVFPYDIYSLTWNKTHKINDEEKYCYCGGPGDWYLKMLQCARCNQWFHEACLQCLDSPILYGDRFFLFVCSVCNEGNEFIKRLPLKWVDIVHLVLYNITIAKKVKYYDVESMIVFFNKHVESLRLTSEMAKEVGTRMNLKHKISETLTHNKSRFQSSGECKKTRILWGLKNRSPPLPPPISLPSGGEVTEETFSTLDLKHGSGTLSDSPTPLKKQGPCQIEGSLSPKSAQHAQPCGRSPVKDLVKSGLFNIAGETSPDAPFESGMPPPERRKAGRPKRGAQATKRTMSSSSFGNSKEWGLGTSKRKRKLSEVSSMSGKTVESNNFTLPKPWGAKSSVLSDMVSLSSSGSSDKMGEDLKSWKDVVAKYFGAEGRVESGERFRVLGKRTTYAPDGTERFEYLIEWEGYTARDLASMKKF